VPVDMPTLCADLQDETTGLRSILATVSVNDWVRPTPAPGWSLADHLTHLAYFDEAAVRSATDPGSFLKERERALVDVDAYTEDIARRYRELDAPAILMWFVEARQRLVDVFSTIDSHARLPWYGPEMSVASAITARIMETWAHGQDIADALGARHPGTKALRHVAHIGVRTFSNSFRAHSLPVPDASVFISLVSPSGERWEWGREDAEDRVTGRAWEFCLVVTQRRHLADTGLQIKGIAARAWMEHAQAFAGPSGSGRSPGQFG
jgi:uncharacterized protein (TIGR03084 family)